MASWGGANGTGGAPRPPRSLRLARAAVAAVFFLDGAGNANWVVRIPAVRAHLGLGAGTLGVALLGVAVGALVTMPLAGRLVARYGSRPVTRAGAFAFAAALALPALAPNLVLLTVALVALGAASGILNIAMNAQASTVERRYGRPVMSSFHALFSFGGLVGASVGGFTAGREIGAAPHLAVVALVVGVLATWAAGWMIPADADASAERSSASSFARPSRALVALGVVAFCVLFGEGAMADWSAVYLRDVAGAGPGLAAAGYAAFSLAMAGGRGIGDALTLRFGRARLVGAGGLVAALGLAAALAVGGAWAGVIGFAAVGAGMSTVFPIVLGEAGRSAKGSPGTAIATVATFGYAGFLAGPPLIGFLGSALTMRGGLAAVVATSAVIVALSRTLRHSPQPASIDIPAAPAPAPERREIAA